MTRTYDTFDAGCEGDFGYGWSLDFAQPELTLDYGNVGGVTFGGHPAFIDGTRVYATTEAGNSQYG